MASFARSARALYRHQSISSCARTQSFPRHPLHLQPRRYISKTSPMPFQPKFSSGEDIECLSKEVEALVDAGWSVDSKGVGIDKVFYYKNYSKCMDFVTAVGIRSKSKKHHSTITLEYGSVQVHWTTHNPHGLSSKDTFMARYCDEQAKMIGAVEKNESAGCGPT